MKKRIHINQHNIRHNANTDNTIRPPVSVKTYKKNHKGFNALITGPSEVVYSPDKPLACGAKVWIETESRVELDGKAI